jgi:hypothetical protein
MPASACLPASAKNLQTVKAPRAEEGGLTNFAAALGNECRRRRHHHGFAFAAAGTGTISCLPSLSAYALLIFKWSRVHVKIQIMRSNCKTNTLGLYPSGDI